MSPVFAGRRWTPLGSAGLASAHHASDEKRGDEVAARADTAKEAEAAAGPQAAEAAKKNSLAFGTNNSDEEEETEERTEHLKDDKLKAESEETPARKGDSEKRASQPLQVCKKRSAGEERSHRAIHADSPSARGYRKRRAHGEAARPQQMCNLAAAELRPRKKGATDAGVAP